MQKKYYYLNMFFIFSIIGYILETIFIKNYQSGILFLPWTPVYGIGILVGILIYKKINKKYSKFLEIMILFFTTMLILSLIEWLSGNLIELLFKQVYWNYDKYKYNLGKYVSLESALIWGIGSVIAVYLLIPIVQKIERFIPKIVTIALNIIFIIDIIITFIVKMP